MRIPDENLAEVFDRGFTVVEGFLDKATLQGAQDALWDIYPRPQDYFADPAAHAKFTRSQFAGRHDFGRTTRRFSNNAFRPRSATKKNANAAHQITGR